MANVVSLIKINTFYVHYFSNNGDDVVDADDDGGDDEARLQTMASI